MVITINIRVNTDLNENESCIGTDLGYYPITDRMHYWIAVPYHSTQTRIVLKLRKWKKCKPHDANSPWQALLNLLLESQL